MIGSLRLPPARLGGQFAMCLSSRTGNDIKRRGSRSLHSINCVRAQPLATLVELWNFAAVSTVARSPL